MKGERGGGGKREKSSGRGVSWENEITQSTEC